MSTAIPMANGDPLRVMQVDQNQQDLLAKRQKKIDELNKFLEEGQRDENQMILLVQKAIDRKDEREAECQQLKLKHVVAKCEFYEKWIKETKAIDCGAKTVTINTVVETMVADEKFQKLENDYEVKRDELQKKRREAYFADLETRRFGPPTVSVSSQGDWQVP